MRWKIRAKHKEEFLLPPEGVVKGSSPFSLREKAGMRGYEIRLLLYFDPLPPTLRLVENSLLGIDCRYKPSHFCKNDTY
jgi:hypothetical protein